MAIFGASFLQPPVTARSLEGRLREAIARGELAAGTRLPPIREAAWSLRCSPGTVARAYRALVVAGLARGEVGRGTFIGPSEAGRAFPPLSQDRQDRDTAAVVDLAVNVFRLVDVSETLATAIGEAAASLSGRGAATGYAPAGGDGDDRAAALHLLGRWRDGLGADDVTICSGTQAALFATLLALREGGALACDALTYPGVLAAAQAIGLRLHGLPMDDEGLCPDALDALARRGGLGSVFLMPAVQNPTGRRMGAERIAALAEVARRHELIVIEDQVYGFLAQDPGVGFSHLAPERSVLLTGLSKCVSPVLRIGYVAAPTLLGRRIKSAHAAMQLMVSPLLTRAASLILRSPAFEACLAALRDATGRRGQLAASVLALPDPVSATGGLAFLECGAGWLAEDFAAEALRIGVRVTPAREFATDPRAAVQGVRLCLAAEPDETRFLEALRRLGALARGPAFRPPAGP